MKINAIKAGMLGIPILWFGLAAALLSYLYVGTGLHSDDYDHLYIIKSWTMEDILTLYKSTPPITLVILPMYYFDYFQFFFFGHAEILYDLSKIAISLFAIYSAWLFASQYIEKPRAFLFSIIFVLFPLHDATNYWFTGTYMMITGAWIMLAHAFINRGSNYLGTLFGVIGAFWSYASPALAGGISLTFLMKREYKKFLLFILPELIYVIYYFCVTKLLGGIEFRTQDISDASHVAKQLLIQVGSFIDSAAGPSFWLKFYYSILSSSWLSLAVGALLAWFFVRLYSSSKPSVNGPLLVAATGVTLCGFLIFSLTGKFPQIAFNIGDRVTYFGSMLLAVLAISIVKNRSLAVMVLLVLAMSITGLSEHWKDWNRRQHEIFENVRTNSQLADIHSGDVLWVSGSQYSKLGPISHIEFFSESGMVRDIFSYALDQNITYQVYSLNHRYHWGNGVISDLKYGTTYQVGNEITIYDSEANRVLKVSGEGINKYINDLPTDRRHWIQGLTGGRLERVILYLMPRLEYIFHS